MNVTENVTTAVPAVPDALSGGLAALAPLAAGPESQQVTDWGERLAWVSVLLLAVIVAYWLMRRGWQRRGTLHADLPEPAPATGRRDGAELTLTGRYHGSTVAGQWLDRIVAHGLGTRSRAELVLTADGLDVLRPGARDFHIPAGDLRGARLDTGIAGKVLTEGGLLVITWRLGDRLVDSGFRSDRAVVHTTWVAHVNDLTGGPADLTAAAVRPGAAGARDADGPGDRPGPRHGTQPEPRHDTKDGTTP
ncbi:PH-like domain-containing protein [Streptomyces zingiberis]|uniref:PH-like domain-containing protein n=1 Tax=Streptomyces zingiberis TaxID=2053010 RepID=UPI001F10366E|nr:hypothetical protein [Streptomyces zingiberis]